MELAALRRHLVTVVALASACGDGGTATALDPGASLDAGASNAAHDLVTCTPNPLDFGMVHPGRTVEREVDCRNDGDARVTGRVGLEAESSPEFSLVPTAESFALPPRSTRGLAVVRYTPLQLGEDEASLQVRLRSSEGSEDEIVVISIFGSGGAADIDVTPAQLYFGLVPVGETSRRTLIITNTGFEPLSISALRFEPEIPAFRLPNVDPIPFVLGPGDVRAQDIEFTYPAEGPLETRLVIESSDWDEPTVEVLVRAG